MPEHPSKPTDGKSLLIEREFAADEDAIRRAFAILLRQRERKDVAA